MKTKPEYLLETLFAFQFRLAWVDFDEGVVKFWRGSRHPDLYERLEVSERGEHGEALDACVEVSVVRHRACWRGLLGSQAIIDFANAPFDRAETIVRSHQERTEWLRKIATIAPGRCEALADSIGAKILNKTAEARSAAQKYFECLNPGDSLSQAWTRLESECSREVLEWIKTVLPRVGWIWWIDVFFLALLLMCRFQQGVEPERPAFQTTGEPDNDDELMWRLILLADRLITEFAEKRNDLVPPPWLFRGEGGNIKRYEAGKL